MSRVADSVSRVADGESRVVDGEGRVAVSEGRVVDGEDRVAVSEGRVVDGEGQVAVSEGRVVDGEGQVAVSEGRVVDGEGRVAVSKGRVVDGEGRVADCGGRVVDGGGRVADCGGRVVDGGGRVAVGGGQVVDGGGRVVDCEAVSGGRVANRMECARKGKPRCCLCNGVNARCTRCTCSRAGRPCASCRPLGDGGCRNPSNRLGSVSGAFASIAGSQAAPAASAVQVPPPGSLSGSVPESSSPLLGVVLHAPSPASSRPSSEVTNQSSSSHTMSSPPSSPLFPSIHAILQVKLPTLQHVPKVVRNEWASILSVLCSDIVRHPSCMAKWQLLFMLPRCILASPVRGGRSHYRETLELVRGRICRWKAGEFTDLWADVVEEDLRWVRKRQRKAPTPNSLCLSNARRARHLTEEGQYKKALQALLSEGIAGASAEVFDQMLSKHPQAAPPSLPQGPPPPPPHIASEIILKAIRSFPAGSAPGPSHLRAAHLKEAVLCPSPGQAAQVMHSLTGLVNLLSSGYAPSEVVPHLCGATLIACKKRGGGLRPIAVGEVLRRLVSKSLSTVLRQEAIQVLSPHQLGVGVKSGCEAIVHSVSRVLEDSNSDPNDCWTLLIDFSNAFNSIDRSSMFQEIRARIPSLSSWLECCYGGRPHLHLEDKCISSCSGVQQGDPLGPLGFAVALQPIVDMINSKVPNLKINAWYLDDGTLVGSPSDLSLALSIVEQEGPPRGLRLNRAKSLLFSPSPTSPISNPLPPEIPLADEGFSLLGCPIGPPSFCNAALLKRVEKVSNYLRKLPDLQDSQSESTLLRHCLSLPKILFSLRTCPPGFIKQATDAFDDLIRDSLADIAGGPLPEWSWRKASLPCSLGGLGLRNASLCAPAAYISSLNEVQPLIDTLLQPALPPLHLSEVIADLASVAGHPDWVSSQSIDVPIRQRPLLRCIDKVSFDLLLSSASDERSKALTLSTSLPHAGDWLQVIPSSALGLHLVDREFRASLQYWLGLRIYEEEYSCPVCKKSADAFGDHQVGCGGNGDRIFRHNAIRDVVFSAAQSAALCPRKEMPSLIPGSRSRPADVYVPLWVGHRPAAMDVTVISPLQQLTLSGASSIAGHALQVAEERKRTAYAELCHPLGIDFVPLALEALGGWSELTCNTIRSISRLQAQRLGIPTTESYHHLAQRIAITLWRGNSSLWMSRQPSIPACVDGRL